MRVAVKFAREGFTKYISHLDVQRVFSRALRRTGLDVRYSKGFNPHMNLSFASAMAVGLQTRGDYMEFWLETPETADRIKERLNQQMPDGFSILAAGELPEHEGKLMALVQQASYDIFPQQNGDAFTRWLKNVMQLEHFSVIRTKKGKEKEIDIRPLIFDMREDEGRISVRLAHSGSMSLSPMLLVEKAGEQEGRPIAAEIVRTELFTIREGKLMALDQIMVQ